jgi:hypothetical protein
MDKNQMEISYATLLDKFKDIQKYIKSELDKDGLLKALLIEFEKPFEDGLISDVKRIQHLDELNISTDEDEIEIEKSYHMIIDNFQRLNTYIFQRYPKDRKLREFLTHILMVIQDLGEHYYWKAIKERDSGNTVEKANDDRVLQ